MINMDKYRENFKPFIVKALKYIPEVDKPEILDVGCGTGVPTIILAELTEGNITGVDIDNEALEILESRIIDKGLEKRVSTVNCSMSKMKFPENSFDIIWAEGSIAAMGFKKGLIAWNPFLKMNGYLVIHDDSVDFDTKVDSIPGCGFKLISHFFISKETWWELYYDHLEAELNKKYFIKNIKPDEDGKKLINELNIFRKDPLKFSSVYFIMQKISD